MANASKLRIGVLGVGAAAQWYYLPAIGEWNDVLQLQSVCDTDYSRAADFGNTYNSESVFTDYGEMLADADVDAVAILTPHSLHAEQCMRALQHDKHVLIEKPLASTLAESIEICELAESKGLSVSCAPPNMLHPGQRRLMQLVEAGAIGKVSLVRATSSSMGPGSRPGAPTDFSWFYQAGAGGMSSMAGYGLIRMTAVVGPVKSLTAMSCVSMPERVIRDGPEAGKRVHVDVPDNNVMTFDFGNGTLGTMDTGYVSMAHESPSMELFGTDGVLSVWGGDQVLEIRIYKDDWDTNVSGWQEVDIPGLHSRYAQHPSTLLSLAEAVLHGKPLINGPRHMAHVVEIMEKTWEAARRGQRVDIQTDIPSISWRDIPFDDRSSAPKLTL